jgi:hypothetical protein
MSYPRRQEYFLYSHHCENLKLNAVYLIDDLQNTPTVYEREVKGCNFDTARRIFGCISRRNVMVKFKNYFQNARVIHFSASPIKLVV